MKDFSFEPVLAKAKTIPSSWYTDAAMLSLEQAQIFRRTWQLVAHISQLQEVGDFFTCDVAGEPIVLVRSQDGQLRGFFNVCKHRAGPVARGCGRRKSLQCFYHGWTYSLEGELLRAPEFEGVACFDQKDFALDPVRVEQWGPFLFANLDPDAPPLREYLGDIPEETAHIPLMEMGHYKRVDYYIDCNWKVYVDNYLEGYHIPTAHPGLFKEVDYKQYFVETQRYYSKQHSPIRNPNSLYRRDLPPDKEPEALYYWLFPNVMLNFYRKKEAEGPAL